MKTRNLSPLYLLTVVLMLPWLNLCVEPIGQMSLVSIREHRLQNSHFKQSNNLDIDFRLTDLVILKSNQLTEFWVLPETEEHPILIPVDIVPSGHTHQEIYIFSTDISKDLVESDNVRCLGVQEFYQVGASYYTKYTIICQVKDRPEEAIAVQRSFSNRNQTLNTHFLLKKVDEKLVLFFSLIPKDKLSKTEFIMELPFPTDSEIRDWGASNFRNLFMAKFAKKPEPLMIKFRNQRKFANLEKNKNIKKIYSSYGNYGMFFFVVSDFMKNGLTSLHILRSVVHKGKIAFQEEETEISKEHWKTELDDIYKLEYLSGTMGLELTFCVNSDIRGAICDSRGPDIFSNLRNPPEPFFDTSVFKFDTLHEIDPTIYCNLRISARLIGIGEMRVVVVAQRRSDRALVIFNIRYEFRNDPREEFIISNQPRVVKNARSIN